MAPQPDVAMIDRIDVRGRRIPDGDPHLDYHDLSWRTEAACIDADPDLFFPERGASTRAAKTICVDCPVRADCLDYAIRTHQFFGIWGGLSERERRSVRAGRRNREVRIFGEEQRPA